MKRVVAVVIVLAAALSAAIGWRIHAQEQALRGPASGSGVVEAEGIDLASRIGARVRRVHAAEGASVAAGAVILELECDEPLARLAEAEARLEAARAQSLAARSQAEAARRQTAAARASVGAAGAQAGALDAQYDVALREAARTDALGEHASVAARDRARATAAGLAEQERAARASQTATRRQAAAASAQADAMEAQAQAADRSVAALEALVRTAALNASECEVRAPRAGVIERVYYEAGELVMPGATVARLIDPEIVRVTFYLANADVDRAQLGMAARVEADAYPGRRFGAVVDRIGLEAEFTPRNVQTRSDRDRLVFPIEVRIDRHERRLRSGMPVTVTLGGDR